MVKVKICGITNIHDALIAVEEGANAVGFIFAPSARNVSPDEARKVESSPDGKDRVKLTEFIRNAKSVN